MERNINEGRLEIIMFNFSANILFHYYLILLLILPQISAIIIHLRSRLCSLICKSEMEWGEGGGKEKDRGGE